MDSADTAGGCGLQLQTGGCNYSAPEDPLLPCSVTFAHGPKLTNKSRLLHSSFSSCDHIKKSSPNAVQTAVIALIQSVIGARW